MTTDLVTRAADLVADDARDASVDRVTVGDAVVLVELAGERGARAGLAHRPPGEPPTDDPDLGALLDAVTAPAESDPDRVRRALGLATLNALSAPHVDWRTGDPMALLDPGVDAIATVGLFRPAFRKFTDVEVRVIERRSTGDVAAPSGVRVRTYTPAETATAMAGAEVVFVTGSAFVYGGVADYLAAAPDAATVVVIGATASFVPDPLFEAGVDVVAGAAVEDPERTRAAVRAGACGTDLHEAGVRKGFVATDRAAGLSLDAAEYG